MATYYETHEPPHCQTCECGVDIRQITRIADERDTAQRELAAYKRAVGEYHTVTTQYVPGLLTATAWIERRVAELLAANA